MTAREFQENFEFAASFYNDLKDISIKSNGVNYFLNEGQNVYINKRLENIRNKIEGKQKDIDELKEIIVRDVPLVIDVPASTSSRNVYTLPSDYLYLINDRSTVSRCNTLKEYDNRLTPLENLHTILDYSHTTTKYNDPVSALSGNSLYIYKTNDFTISTVNIDYVRDYNDIDVINNVTSELNDNVHREIIQMAINIFLENVQSGRFNTNVQKSSLVTEQIK